MSIPMIFEAFKFSNHIPNDHIYVDGGAVLDYPINTYDHEGRGDSSTLGMFLKKHPTKNNLHFGLSELPQYFKYLFESGFNSQDIDVELDPRNLTRSIVIPTGQISPTHFDINHDEKTYLINSTLTHSIRLSFPDQNVRPSLLMTEFDGFYHVLESFGSSGVFMNQ
jgi:NTE family protein